VIPSPQLLTVLADRCRSSSRPYSVIATSSGLFSAGCPVTQRASSQPLMPGVLEVLGHQQRVAVKLVPDPEVVEVGVRPAHRREAPCGCGVEISNSALKIPAPPQFLSHSSDFQMSM
jgi:hypothetical protein